MRLLAIEPGERLWGSENAFLATVPELVKANERLVVLVPPHAESIKQLSGMGAKVETASIANLHRRGLLAKISAVSAIAQICLRNRIEKIYLNQAGLCRIAHSVARVLRLPLVIHVRLLEDVPRCAALSDLIPIDLIFVSQDIRRHYPDGFTDKKRLLTAYDPIVCYKTPQSLQRQSDLSIAVLGRIEPSKGQHRLIEALSLGPKPPPLLHIYGDAPDLDYGEELRKRADELGIAERIVWHGYQASAASELEKHSIVVVCSDYESFGRVVVEALQAGALPVASTQSGGPAEIISRSGGGLLYEGQTPEAITEALTDAIGLGITERQIIIEKGRAWVRERLSIPAYKSALSGILFSRAQGREHVAALQPSDLEVSS